MSPRFPRAVFRGYKFFLTNWMIPTRMFRVTSAKDQASQGQPRLNYGWISQCVPEVFPYLISRFRSLIKLRSIAQLFANRLRRPFIIIGVAHVQMSGPDLYETNSDQVLVDSLSKTFSVKNSFSSSICSSFLASSRASICRSYLK